MAVAVIVDSSSCITKEVAEAYHLHVVPLHLIWGKKEYADWVDMTPEEFHARIKTEKMENWPTSSGSVQGEFLEAFRDKGRFRPFLEKVPVKVVLDETAALLGAARFAQARGEGT